MQHLPSPRSSSFNRPDGCDSELVNDGVSPKQCQMAEKELSDTFSARKTSPSSQQAAKVHV